MCVGASVVPSATGYFSTMRRGVGTSFCVWTSDADGVASAFVCAQGTVSELIARHALRRVDLLKVDVEGDELLVLRGVGADDWPKVQQVAVEVHDVHGRLDAFVALLRRHRFATTVVAQATSTEKGYRMVVPPALKLFYVYGVRRGRKRRRF